MRTSYRRLAGLFQLAAAALLALALAMPISAQVNLRKPLSQRGGSDVAGACPRVCAVFEASAAR